MTSRRCGRRCAPNSPEPRMKPKPDWFILGIFAAVALAWIFPAAGAEGGWMHANLLNKVGVALIFFINGMTLSFAALKAGTLRWPVHVVVQTSVFLLFPLLGLAVLAVGRQWLPSELGTGFFF